MIMADLSSLLNPAPSSEGLAREAQIAERHVGHSGGKPPNLPPVQIGALSLQPSMKSPLDTLADAATSSAPMLSPTNPNGTSYMSFGPYRHLPGRPSSRPTSSRITPPLAYDQSHAPAPTSPTFSPGLQQYHHPTSSEVRARRASEAAETSIGSLPPLRRPFSDNGHPGSTDQFGPPLHQDESALPILPGIDAAAALVDEQPAEAREGPTPVTSQIRQASPGPSIPAQDLNLPPTQSEQAPVKTEIDSTPDFNSTSIQPPAPAPEPPYEHNQETESAPPTVDMKPKSSPAPSNASAQNNMLKPQPAPSRKRPAPKKGTATAVKPAAKRRKVEKPTETIEKTSPLARSGTPYSSRASKTPAPKNRKQASVTPQRSSSVANDDEDEDEDEDGVFCICRGPDNHTWMIACDGPCEDWFHGRCIDMTEKEGELIEKYYCTIVFPPPSTSS